MKSPLSSYSRSDYDEAIVAATKYILDGGDLDTFHEMCKTTYRNLNGHEPEGSELVVGFHPETKQVLVGYISSEKETPLLKLFESEKS